MFDKILYFYPERGQPKQYHGYLQQELKLIYSCFQEQIFSKMVVVCTDDSEPTLKVQGIIDTDRAKDELKSALNFIPGKDARDLEVMYIPLKEETDGIQ